jgi:mRNA-degrading endonuclease toxin of MazEF toxin-antitoxin module
MFMKKKQDAEKLRDRALSDINAYITELYNSTDEKKRKKASLVSHWLTDYIRLLKKEETFESLRQLSYKRGSIVKVHLGFRIGSEEGGLHYAAVLDREPKKSLPVITIVPLSSQKGGRIIRYNEVSIGNEVFRKITNKRDKLRDNTAERVNKIEIDLKNEKINTAEFISEAREELKILTRQLEQLDNLRKEISRMNQGSIALVGQITTISKIRIYDPTHSGQLLDGISLNPKTLDMIDEKIKELYTKT